MLVIAVALTLGLAGCGIPTSVSNAPTPIPSLPSPGVPSLPPPPTPRTQPDLDATAQAALFDSAPTIEREQCCESSPTGMIDRLSVRLDAFSTSGAIQAMRIVVEPGQDCGGRTPDTIDPIPSSVDAPWESYTNLLRDYVVAVPQARLRILAQFRDSQGHIFPTLAGCDDVIGLGMTRQPE
jgi:hypothetical protein